MLKKRKTTAFDGQAVEAGQMLKDEGFKFDIVFTSGPLKKAVLGCFVALWLDGSSFTLFFHCSPGWKPFVQLLFLNRCMRCG